MLCPARALPLSFLLPIYPMPSTDRKTILEVVLLILDLRSSPLFIILLLELMHHFPAIMTLDIHSKPLSNLGDRYARNSFRKPHNRLSLGARSVVTPDTNPAA